MSLFTQAVQNQHVSVKAEQIAFSICPTINGTDLSKYMLLVNLLVELGQGQQMTGKLWNAQPPVWNIPQGNG